MDERDALAKLLQPRPCDFQGRGVAVEPDEPPCL
jgi:hypothetical protein